MLVHLKNGVMTLVPARNDELWANIKKVILGLSKREIFLHLGTSSASGQIMIVAPYYKMLCIV